MALFLKQLFFFVFNIFHCFTTFERWCCCEDDCLSGHDAIKSQRYVPECSRNMLPLPILMIGSGFHWYVIMYWTTWHHIPEVSYLYTHCSGDLTLVLFLCSVCTSRRCGNVNWIELVQLSSGRPCDHSDEHSVLDWRESFDQLKADRVLYLDAVCTFQITLHLSVFIQSDWFLSLLYLPNDVSHHLHLPLRNVRVFPVHSWSSLGYFMLFFG